MQFRCPYKSRGINANLKKSEDYLHESQNKKITGVLNTQENVK